MLDFDIPKSAIKTWEQEGLSVFYRDDGYLEIQKIDESDAFMSDDDAVSYCIKKASQGSKSHLLALWLDGRNFEDKRKSNFWIPQELKEL